jgi:hypothetical protein
VYLGVEQFLAGQGHAVGDADVSDVAARPGGADCLQHGFLRADGLDHRVRAQAAGHLLDDGDALVAAPGDDVGGAVLQGELLPGLVPAHRDNPLSAQLPGGEHREQPDRPVADDRDGLARSRFGGNSAEPAGAEDIGRGEQIGDKRVGRDLRGSDEGAVGERHAQQLGLGPARTGELDAGAAALVTGLADRAGVVGGHERADDELAGPDVAYGGPGFLDDAGVFVAHRGGLGDRVGAAPGPQVRAAHAGGGQPDDRVGRFDDRRVRPFFDPDVAGALHDCSAHGGFFLSRLCR